MRLLMNLLFDSRGLAGLRQWQDALHRFRCKRNHFRPKMQRFRPFPPTPTCGIASPPPRRRLALVLSSRHGNRGKSKETGPALLP